MNACDNRNHGGKESAEVNGRKGEWGNGSLPISPSPTHPLTHSPSVVGHTIELIASAWLMVVAVQYISRYFVAGLDAGFNPVYCVMLALLIVAGALRLWRRPA